MSKYMTQKEIQEQARSEHATADSLNILVTNIRQQSSLDAQDSERLSKLLSEIEEKLKELS